jgi:hypothetical protein
MPSKELVAASTVPLVLSILAEGEDGHALIQRVRELSAGQIEDRRHAYRPAPDGGAGPDRTDRREAETGASENTIAS